MSSTLTVTNLTTTNVTATNLTDGGGTTSTFANVVSGSAKVICTFDANPNVVIEESFNTTSMTDNATGSYNVNFTNNLSSSTYAYSYLNNTYTSMGSAASTSSSARMFAYDAGPSATDVDKNMFLAVGDLA